jgi:hypothetical protein
LKLHINNKKYSIFKDITDEIGKKMGLTPLNWREKVKEKRENLKNGISTEHLEVTRAEHHITAKNENNQGVFTWKEALRKAIDEAREICTTRKEFQKYLKEEFGVEMPRNTENTISFIHPAVKKSVRGARLGADYTAESIDIDLNNNLQKEIFYTNNLNENKKILERRLQNELRFTEQRETESRHIQRSRETQQDYTRTKTTEITGSKTNATTITTATNQSNTTRNKENLRNRNDSTIYNGTSQKRVRNIPIERSLSEIERKLRSVDETVQSLTKNNGLKQKAGNGTNNNESKQLARKQQTARSKPREDSYEIGR